MGDKKDLRMILLGMLTVLFLLPQVNLNTVTSAENDGPYGSVIFQRSELISQAPNGTYQYFPSISSSGSQIYVAWQDSRSGDYDVLLSSKNTTGGSWSQPVHIDDSKRNNILYDDGSEQLTPSIDAKGNLVSAGWVDDREGKNLIYTSLSRDGGKSFGKSVPPYPQTYGVQSEPDVAFSPMGEICVVWVDTGDDPNGKIGRIYFSKGRPSLDSIDFSPPVPLSPPARNQKADEPSIFVDDTGGIYVVFSGEVNGDRDIYITTSFDGGESFTEPIDLINDTTYSSQQYPDVVSDGNNILLVWQDFRNGNWDIYSTISYDGGVNFTKEKMVNNDTTDSGQYYPSAALSPNGTIYIVFGDTRRKGDEFDVYMAYTTDWGRSFCGDYRVPDDKSGKTQDRPKAACPQEGPVVLSVAYHDSRDTWFRIRVSNWIPGASNAPLPLIKNVYVSPDVGAPGTTFYFKATYFHAENVGPEDGFPRLWFYYKANNELRLYPGSPFVMKRRIMPAQDFIYTNGEEYIKILTLTASVKYYYRVEARAKDDFRSVFSNLTEGPIVDNQPPEFIDIDPKITGWSPNRTITFKAIFKDTGAGVDPRDVYVSFSYNGPGGLDTWHHYGSVYEGNNSTLISEVPFTLANGTNNVIRWKALDRAGNGFTYSPIFTFWYDGEGPLFSLLSPKSGKILFSTKINATILVSDPGGSGVLPGSIQYRLSVNGINGYSKWTAIPGGNIVKTPSGYLVNLSLSIKWGWNNFLQLRACDVMGNFAESFHYQLPAQKPMPKEGNIGNLPPEKPSNFQPMQTADQHPHIFWTASKDPNGDEVTYRLRIGSLPNLGDILNWVKVGNDNYYDVPENVTFEWNQTYYVQIVASDGILNSTPLTGEIKVIPTADHPPTTPGPLYPSKITVETGVVQWGPSWDKDGDPIVYFVRIGSTPSGDNIMKWRTTYKNRYVELPTWLGVGRYWVQLMASDGMDFSRVGTYELTIGIFRVHLSGDNRITLHQTGSDYFVLNITNFGTSDDTFVMSIGGSFFSAKGLKVKPTSGIYPLPPGGSKGLIFNITAQNAPLGTYYLNITVISSTSSASARSSVMVLIIQKTNFTGLQPTPSTEGVPWAQISGFGIISLVLIVLIIREFMMSKRGKREEE